MGDDGHTRIKQLPPEIENVLSQEILAKFPGIPYVMIDQFDGRPLTSAEETKTVDAILKIATQFRKDGDNLLKGFCACYKLGVYPPVWIMDELYKIFESYITDNQGGRRNADLGKYFHGAPRRIKWRKDVHRSLLITASSMVYSLHEWFDVNVEEAIGYVSDWMIEQQKKSLPVGWKGERLKCDAALRRYYYDGGGREGAKKISRLKQPPTNQDKKGLLDTLAAWLPDKESLENKLGKPG